MEDRRGEEGERIARQDVRLPRQDPRIKRCVRAVVQPGAKLRQERPEEEERQTGVGQQWRQDDQGTAGAGGRSHVQFDRSGTRRS